LRSYHSGTIADSALFSFKKSCFKTGRGCPGLAWMELFIFSGMWAGMWMPWLRYSAAAAGGHFVSSRYPGAGPGFRHGTGMTMPGNPDKYARWKSPAHQTWWMEFKIYL